MGSCNRPISRRFLALAAIGALFLVLGCSSMLPSVKETTQIRWASFDEVKAAYDKVVPYETTMEEFRETGFDPSTTANVQILTYLDVMNRFLPNPSIKVEDLPPGVQECFKAQDRCVAYQLDISKLYSNRYGDVVADLFNFRRKTHHSGWTFNALFVVVDDTVAYKLWSGTRAIDTTSDKKNPLGPLQSSEDILRSAVTK